MRSFTRKNHWEFMLRTTGAPLLLSPTAGLAHEWKVTISSTAPTKGMFCLNLPHLSGRDCNILLKIKWIFTCMNSNINNSLFYGITISAPTIRFIQHTQRDAPAEPWNCPFKPTALSNQHHVLKGKKLSRKVKYIPVTADLFFFQATIFLWT